LITTGGKLWFAVTLYALAAAVVYYVATAGEHGGGVTLQFIAAGAAVMGFTTVAVRDGDDDAATDKEAVRVRSALPAPWPALLAVGGGVTAVGYAAGGLVLYIGFGIIGVALLEWMVQGWAERSTADPAYNKALRDRIMFPVEIPAAGIIILGVVIIAMSRVLLALPNKNASTIVAICVGTVITATAFIVASRTRISTTAIAWVLAIAAVALLAGGITGGVVGERSSEEPVSGADHEGNANNDQQGGASANEDTPAQQATTTSLGTNP
jgi:hypothetical protein